MLYRKLLLWFSTNSSVPFQTNAKHIAIVAHSFGGIVTLNLALEFKGDFLNRVFSVMLTDSVHHLDPKNKEKELVHFLRKISINFVASDEELGTPIRSKIEAIPMVSAGHEVHEWTSTSCKELLFEQLLSRLNKRLSENPNSEGGGSNPADSI
jgi:alpha/beta superfamily hydrolase